MRKYAFLLLISFTFSCKSTTKHPIKDSITTIPSDNSLALIKKLKPVLQGTWVKKTYIDKVVKTRSPLAAVDEANDMTTFVITTEAIKGDSLTVPAGWGNHDGSEFTLKFKLGKMPSSILFGKGELGVSELGGETILTYYHPNEKGHIIATRYIKAQLKKPSELGEGIYYLVNKGLIAGNYVLTDSAGINSKINFEAHGTVTGFLNFNYYSINIDLNSDQMDNLDEISFGIHDKNKVAFSFKFDADTLKLISSRLSI